MRRHLMMALVLCGLGLPALSGDFYQQYLSIVDSNRFTQPLSVFPVVADTNNTGIKVTNAVLDLKSLKQSGQISWVCLGMTMQEVVDRWGKPKGGWTRCLHGLITFFYSGVSLGFEGNRLETIRLSPPANFTGGLSSFSQVNEFIRVLGPPTSHRDYEYHRSLVYLSPAANLALDFSDEELTDISLERTPARAEPWKQTIGANPQGGANGRQPFTSDTNRTPSAAASRRSP